MSAAGPSEVCCLSLLLRLSTPASSSVQTSLIATLRGLKKADKIKITVRDVYAPCFVALVHSSSCRLPSRELRAKPQLLACLKREFHREFHNRPPEHLAYCSESHQHVFNHIRHKPTSESSVDIEVRKLSRPARPRLPHADPRAGDFPHNKEGVGNSFVLH